MLNGIKKAVFFAAHTDDEMICAGTLHRLVRSGCELHVVAFSPAATADDRRGIGTCRWNVEQEWNASLDLIGVRKSARTFLNFLPSSELHERRQEVCQTVYDWVERHKPDAAFILSPEDENTAHSVVGAECERVMRGRVPLTIRCQFPWNYGIGRPNLYVRLSDEDFACKRLVIQAYASQAFRYDYETMLCNYAIADGLSVKMGPCEKFEVIRAII